MTELLAQDPASWLDSPHRMALVAGAQVCYWQIGDPSGPPVVLVHGGAGHGGWWIHVVPELARTCNVIVLELSGHGRSDHRDSYPASLWAEEIAAVIEVATGGDAHLVGHSMGGVISTLTAAAHPELVRTLLLIDSRVVRTPGPRGPARSQTLRHYASEAEALTNFRLRPRGTTADPETLERVARTGLCEDAVGWRWRFDPFAWHRMPDDEIASALPQIVSPVEFLYGERSELVGPENIRLLSAAMGREVPYEMAADAYHHVPLDNPAATLAAIHRVVTRYREPNAAPRG